MILATCRRLGYHSSHLRLRPRFLDRGRGHFLALRSLHTPLRFGGLLGFTACAPIYLGKRLRESGDSRSRGDNSATQPSIFEANALDTFACPSPQRGRV